MRQYFLFPVVFGFGLVFSGLIDALMPSWVGWWESGKDSKDIHSTRPTRSSNDSLSPERSETISREGEVTQLRVDGDFLKRESRKPFVKLPKEADCDPRSHVLVINSEGPGGQQRRDYVNREFAKAGLAGRFSFWPAESEESLAEEREGSKEGNHLLLQAKRHRKIYETLLRMKWACATIFEDNVRLVDDFFARLTSITVTESIPPFDVIFWGCNLSVDKAIDGQKQELAFGQPGPCLFAYTVSLQGAFLLLQASMAIKAEGEEMNWTAADQNVRLIRPRIRSSSAFGGMVGSFWHVVPMMAFQG